MQKPSIEQIRDEIKVFVDSLREMGLKLGIDPKTDYMLPLFFMVETVLEATPEDVWETIPETMTLNYTIRITFWTILIGNCGVKHDS